MTWYKESQRHLLASKGINSSPVYFVSNGKQKMNKLEKKIIEYLKQMVEMKKTMGRTSIKDYDYNGMEEYILKNGQFFKPIKRPNNIRQMEMKQCYHNSFMCFAENQELHYVEGYAFSESTKDIGMAFDHAWLVNDRGEVIDPTWTDGAAYFGVAFDRDYTFKTIMKKGYTGLIDNWQEKWPLLKKDKPEIRKKIKVK